MSGFFGCVSRKDCVVDVFYGTDYHSHLGTKRAGLAFYNGTDFNRSIHSLESAYFRNKFEPELDRFAGSNLGIGVISDMESQPITVTSHLGRFAVVVVGRLANLNEIVDEFLKERKHFAELSSSTVNPTEAVAMLINAGNTFKEGIENVYNKVKGSCSFLILTETGRLGINMVVRRLSWGKTSMDTWWPARVLRSRIWGTRSCGIFSRGRLCRLPGMGSRR